jgi:hypothetical protein
LFEDQVTLRVHSVFKQTVNLTDGNRIYTLQHSDLPSTPLSIKVEISRKAFENLIPIINQKIQFNQKGFVAFGSVFEIKDKMESECEIKTDRLPTSAEVSNLFDELTKQLFDHNGKGEMVKAAHNVITESKSNLTIFGEHMEKVMNDLMISDSPQDIAHQALKLIGVGEGLTPSGDDFNCGFAAALFYLKGFKSADEIHQVHQSELPKLWDSTTTISREYLIYAHEGKFNEWVIRLFEYCNKGKDIVPTLNEIKTLGHSSGSDFLTGMYFGLRAGGKLT